MKRTLAVTWWRQLNGEAADVLPLPITHSDVGCPYNTIEAVRDDEGVATPRGEGLGGL